MKVLFDGHKVEFTFRTKDCPIGEESDIEIETDLYGISVLLSYGLCRTMHQESAAAIGACETDDCPCVAAAEARARDKKPW